MGYLSGKEVEKMFRVALPLGDSTSLFNVLENYAIAKLVTRDTLISLKFGVKDKPK